MITLSGITLIKLVVVLGLAIWCLLESWGLIRDFIGSKRAIGRIMNMELLEEEPVTPTKLLNRRISNEWCHWVSTVVFIAFNLVSSLLLFIAVYYFFEGGMIENRAQSQFLLWANYGIAMFIGMSFALSYVGLWFAYYVKQSDLMLVHFVLMTLGVVSAVIVNL
ncbi:DUF2165 family protein [Xenorhabdus szentirmaii]|uniref:DUF2165 domain-containing protein n=2 Tax=Xenorhabdus szentirmaii TaxID=290112 RepID=W1ISX5_9GAMM|nr:MULTISPECIES: DUF2165 family protein [Xenorhabdus]MBD2779183.1 DUF2165 family protein [Xenorhabdus sp. 38]MBD2802604.1 DUF2165 family protein [Xenorhabdus sp. M]MBD2805789.1 DUF2165 family protein [Xenorhabdus sp. ZM]MBD2821339.1 DUF2165 family protein [Xenorhabdus sp. 42]MBD2826567.1 DUF2165 family protein [Xenorhabdus sp. 5]